MAVMAIDFGTTNTAVICYDERTKEVVEIPYQGRIRLELKKTIPSVVAFDRDGNALYVGDATLDYGRAFPHLCVDKIKRMIGKSYEEALNDPLFKNIGYKIVEGEEIKRGEGHLALVEVGDRAKKRYRPEEVAGLIIKEAREAAETYLQQERRLSDLRLTKVMMTVPAHFNANQRDRIREAARLAGFDEKMIELLNEPTAAAFDAVLRGKITKDKETIMVVNVGSGTTDIAVVDVRRTPALSIESWAVGGETRLGGTDMDIAIVDWVIAQLSKEKGVDQAALKGIDRGALRAEAEEAKIALSEGRVDVAEIRVRDFAKHIPLTAGDLENVVKPIVEECRRVIVKVLSDRGVKKDDFNRIILTGGPMAMPLVKRAVVEEFGDRIIDGIDPMTCVARGAAVAPMARYTTVPSRPIILSIGDRLEQVVSADTPLPSSRYFEWKVSPHDSMITIGVLQETEKSREERIYWAMGEYTYYITPPMYEEIYYVACTVGKEEDKIKVAVVDSKEELDRYLEDPDAYEGSFKVEFIKITGEKTIKRDGPPSALPKEFERVLVAFAQKAPMVYQLLIESFRLIEAATKLREAGYKPPVGRESLVVGAVNLGTSLYSEVVSTLVALARENLSDDELDREVAKLGEKIKSSEEFRTLKALVESEEWKRLTRDWVIPEEEISRVVKLIANSKTEVRKMLDAVGSKLPEGISSEAEGILNSLDSIQTYCEGKAEIKVWSKGGELFNEGRTLLERLRGLTDHYLRPLFGGQ